MARVTELMIICRGSTRCGHPGKHILRIIIEKKKDNILKFFKLSMELALLLCITVYHFGLRAYVKNDIFALHNIV